jgi:hypothetical protein
MVSVCNMAGFSDATSAENTRIGKTHDGDTHDDFLLFRLVESTNRASIRRRVLVGIQYGNQTDGCRTIEFI